jgi:hypothetical protein
MLQPTLRMLHLPRVMILPPPPEGLSAVLEAPGTLELNPRTLSNSQN